MDIVFGLVFYVLAMYCSYRAGGATYYKDWPMVAVFVALCVSFLLGSMTLLP